MRNSPGGSLVCSCLTRLLEFHTNTLLDEAECTGHQYTAQTNSAYRGISILNATACVIDLEKQPNGFCMNSDIALEVENAGILRESIWSCGSGEEHGPVINETICPIELQFSQQNVTCCDFESDCIELDDVESADCSSQTFITVECPSESILPTVAIYVTAFLVFSATLLFIYCRHAKIAKLSKQTPKDRENSPKGKSQKDPETSSLLNA